MRTLHLGLKNNTIRRGDRWTSFYIMGTLFATLLALPVIYVIIQAGGTEFTRWQRLWNVRIPSLLSNTLQLTLSVTLAAVLIGVSLAWLVERVELPFRNFWRWALALPLLIPPYIGAVAYIIILGPKGWVASLWESTIYQRLGWSYPLQIYSFWGIFFVLTLFTYPYVFIITSAAIRKISGHYDELARSHGYTTFQLFRHTHLPLLQPAILAGAILISLYVLSDFGAVGMLRYLTFTTAIYYQMGSYDQASATILSTFLIGLMWIILWLKVRLQRDHHVAQQLHSFQPAVPLKISKVARAGSLFFISLLFMLAFLIPLVVFLYWSWQAFQLGNWDPRFWEYAWNSLQISLIAAILSVVIALPIIYLKLRQPTRWSEWIYGLSYIGYSLPGIIVGLGLIFIFNRYIPWLYQTPFILIIAYTIRFIPQAMQGEEASLQLLSPRIEEAARSLGRKPLTTLFTVIVPAILPGILAGGALVFVSALKELPATLLLRPPGFDTLAIRIWVETNEALYYLAAPAALFIILISILPLRWLLSRST
ncbi:ABC transporter permease [Rubeoparvulum massiliense]|uniref:ABC transporter permease n=1 Tax=Rubeoparvulum massiliense TaxID=1631346 RepID=UPI00069D86E7|nr:iron ABC transporter permease [Rubeoparvulum massiliense]